MRRLWSFIFWNVYKNSSKNFQNFKRIFLRFWTKTINYFYFCSNKISNFILEHSIFDTRLHIFHLHIFTRIVQLKIHVIFNIWWFATVKNSFTSWCDFIVLGFGCTGQASCSLKNFQLINCSSKGFQFSWLKIKGIFAAFLSG